MVVRDADVAQERIERCHARAAQLRAHSEELAKGQYSAAGTVAGARQAVEVARERQRAEAQWAAERMNRLAWTHEQTGERLEDAARRLEGGERQSMLARAGRHGGYPSSIWSEDR